MSQELLSISFNTDRNDPEKFVIDRCGNIMDATSTTKSAARSLEMNHEGNDEELTTSPSSQAIFSVHFSPKFGSLNWLIISIPDIRLLMVISSTLK